MVRIAVSALMFLVLPGCSQLHFASDYDPQAPLADARTFGLMTPSAEESDALRRINPFLERRLERAVEAEMTARGLAPATDGTPDVWVAAYPVLLPATDVSPEPASRLPSPMGVSVGLSFGPTFFAPGLWGFPYHRIAPRGFGHWGYGVGCCAYPAVGFGVQSFGGYGGMEPGWEGRNRPGTLVVEVLDGDSQEVVWQGWAENALQEAPRDDALDAYVRDVVTRILKDFPPGS